MFSRILKICSSLRPPGPGSSQFGNFTKFSTFHKGSDSRRKRLIFRCLNTGMKELDIILGQFIQENPEVLESEAAELESFLEMDTCSIYDIVMGKREHNDNLAKKIRAFATNHNKNKNKKLELK